ncbi:hypothetical protein CYMTET_41560 [Cymbomonas tetramitiformis]|uniref:Uncharacterized protein n=1 Tax=Cymbomonas tetramitiformis TaxID=36881 RepID=A0AAE0C5W4_9CHLO|nr:hypothetical protein CYMTET_41560 [Cymbomonas tetramitiformis]
MCIHTQIPSELAELVQLKPLYTAIAARKLFGPCDALVAYDSCVEPHESEHVNAFLCQNNVHICAVPERITLEMQSADVHRPAITGDLIVKIMSDAASSGDGSDSSQAASPITFLQCIDLLEIALQTSDPEKLKGLWLFPSASSTVVPINRKLYMAEGDAFEFLKQICPEVTLSDRVCQDTVVCLRGLSNILGITDTTSHPRILAEVMEEVGRRGPLPPGSCDDTSHDFRSLPSSVTANHHSASSRLRRLGSTSAVDGHSPPRVPSAAAHVLAPFWRVVDQEHQNDRTDFQEHLSAFESDGSYVLPTTTGVVARLNADVPLLYCSRIDAVCSILISLGCHFLDAHGLSVKALASLLESRFVHHLSAQAALRCLFSLSRRTHGRSVRSVADKMVDDLDSEQKDILARYLLCDLHRTRHEHMQYVGGDFSVPFRMLASLPIFTTAAGRRTSLREITVVDGCDTYSHLAPDHQFIFLEDTTRDAQHAESLRFVLFEVEHVYRHLAGRLTKSSYILSAVLPKANELALEDLLSILNDFLPEYREQANQHDDASPFPSCIPCRNIHLSTPARAGGGSPRPACLHHPSDLFPNNVPLLQNIFEANTATATPSSSSFLSSSNQSSAAPPCCSNFLHQHLSPPACETLVVLGLQTPSSIQTLTKVVRRLATRRADLSDRAYYDFQRQALDAAAAPDHRHLHHLESPHVQEFMSVPFVLPWKPADRTWLSLLSAPNELYPLSRCAHASAACIAYSTVPICPWRQDMLYAEHAYFKTVHFAERELQTNLEGIRFIEMDKGGMKMPWQISLRLLRDQPPEYAVPGYLESFRDTLDRLGHMLDIQRVFEVAQRGFAALTPVGELVDALKIADKYDANSLSLHILRTFAKHANVQEVKDQIAQLNAIQRTQLAEMT